ncbi:hypothetical protein SDC9_40005 [bioreactor metagenome]|uniref:DUF1887 family protein n=1 Tax=bioreactor metagenome TaxID=1076179 RepID=A0A644VRG0_9ZZZZ|nr:DUF1887 family CARF protein [Paludibacter sp.]
MKTLLVSLVSDQTIPNVQLIEEFKNQVYCYLFITTKSKKDRAEWIIKSSGISHACIKEIEVNEFSFDDIETKLDTFPFDEYERKILNLTGGTKVMVLASYEYFKELGAEIYYLTGNENEYIKLAPGRKKKVFHLNSKLNLHQYLIAYGFNVSPTSPSSISFEITQNTFNKYIEGKFLNYENVLSELRKNRSKKNIDISLIENLSNFLNEIKFIPQENNKLNRLEIKYLTGEWFEEYVAHKIQKELNLSNDEIKTGLIITKKNRNGVDIQNEMDVLFIYNDKLYTIECKTSIYITSNIDGKMERTNILKETIFKSDSLKQGFGLYVNTSIFILDDLQSNINLERAHLSNISIFDKKSIKSSTQLKDILKIK